MAPRKKATTKGPFFFFMLDFRQRQQARGRKFLGGMEQVMKEAGPYWDCLDEASKEVYKKRANAFKQAPNGASPEKYTSHGIPLTQYELSDKVQRDKQAKIRKVIAEMINASSSADSLDKMKIYMISFNYFCRTSSGTFIPAEMALASYNLEFGVLDKIHELINPQKLPLGLAYEASVHSEQTHQLPVPPNALGETDYSTLLDKILDFTNYESKSLNCFPLFTDEQEIPMTEDILKQLGADSQHVKYLICPLGEFFFQLKRATEMYGLDICTFPAKSVADILLTKDAYEFTSGIACEFHENEGNPNFCPLSRVIRWSYIISDNCCLDLNIDLIAGRHLPQNANTSLCTDLSETKFSQSQDRMSFVSESDLTHVTLPKLHKHRSINPFRYEHGSSVSGSSRSTDIRNIKRERMCDDNAETFKLPGPVDYIGMSPFNRRIKQEHNRPTHTLEVTGHGRGSLLGLTATINSQRSRPSEMFRAGIGRGTSVASSNVSFGTTSTVTMFTDDDN